MNEDIRKFKVSELNRILPMVRETIKKELQLRQLKAECAACRSQDKQNLEFMQHCKALLSFNKYTLSPSAQNEIMATRQIANMDHIKLFQKIQTLSGNIENLSAVVLFEKDLYRHIILPLYDHFMAKEDIQVDFILEYLYLAFFSTHTDGKLCLATAFTDEPSKLHFYNLVVSKLSSEKADLIFANLSKRSDESILAYLLDIISTFVNYKEKVE